MKTTITAILTIFTHTLLSQVGIGTTEPSARLDILSSTSMPALELNPQSNPTGTATGQIAVIGDQLFLYDENRSKWLSVGSSLFNFGEEGYSGDEFLEYAGDINDSGPEMPYNGTIVYATFNTTNGDPNHSGSIQVFDTTTVPETLVSSTPIELVGGSRIYQNLNLDFDAGDKLRVYIDPTGWGIENASVVFWVKWRN